MVVLKKWIFTWIDIGNHQEDFKKGSTVAGFCVIKIIVENKKSVVRLREADQRRGWA